MRFEARLDVVTDGAQMQVASEGLEGRFDFGRLHVAIPQRGRSLQPQTLGFDPVFGRTPFSADPVFGRDLTAGGYSTVARDTLDRPGIGIVEVYDVDDANTGGPRLINVSNRGFVGTGAQVMIPGFVVQGTGARRYLVRAVGPKLADFGLPAASLLGDPRLSVSRSTDLGPVEVAANDNWAVQTNTGGSSADVLTLAQQVGAFSLSASASLPTEDQQSAALIVWLQPGNYTVIVSGANAATGIVIAEVYEVP